MKKIVGRFYLGKTGDNDSDGSVRCTGREWGLRVRIRVESGSINLGVITI